MPEISVVMSVYNAEKYLAVAIDSILQQTFTDFEFIICDDASSDDTKNILIGYQKLDPRIVVINNNENLGLAASLNRCIDLAKSMYIARMDADDICMKDRFRKQYDFMNNHPDIAFVCGGVYLIDDNGVWGKRMSTKPLSKENIFKYQPIAHPTVMIKKSVLLQVNMYTVSSITKRGQDFDLWCKIYEKGFKGDRLEEYLLYYREDQNSYQKRAYRYRLDSYRMKLNWRKKLKLPFSYILYALKPLIIGLIPRFMLIKYHSFKFR